MSYMKELMIDFDLWWKENYPTYSNPGTFHIQAQKAFCAGAALFSARARWFDWMRDRCYGSGDGKGHLYWFYIPYDHEDMGCAIEKCSVDGIHAPEDERERILGLIRQFYPELQQKPATAKETASTGIEAAVDELLAALGYSRCMDSRHEIESIIARHCIDKVDAERAKMGDKGWQHGASYWEAAHNGASNRAATATARADNLQAELQTANESIAGYREYIRLLQKDRDELKAKLIGE